MQAIKNVVLSPSGVYQYELCHIWAKSKKRVLFILMNPDSLQHEFDDPVLDRCRSLAKSWNFGGYYVGHLYGFRAKNYGELKAARFPAGDRNTVHLMKMAEQSEIIVCAWGNSAMPIVDALPFPLFTFYRDKLRILDVSPDDTPKHVMDVRKQVEPINWE